MSLTSWQQFSARFLPRHILGRLTLLLLLTLFPTFVLQGWIYYDRYRARQADELQSQLEVARGVAQDIRSFLLDLHRQSLAIGRAIEQIGPFDADRASGLLVASQREYPSVRSMAWTSPTGKVLASSQRRAIGTSLRGEPFIERIRQGRDRALSDLFAKSRIDGSMGFILARGIKDGRGQLRGIVVTVVDPDRLGVRELGGQRGNEGAYAIFDGQGRVVFRSPLNELNWEQRNRWRASDPLLEQVLQDRKEHVGDIDLPVLGKGSWLSSRVPVTGTSWVVGAGRPAQVVLAPVWQSLVRDLLLLAVVDLLAFAVALSLASTISRPIARMAHDARKGRSGSPAAGEDPEAPFELQDLRRSINEMTANLTSGQESVRVSERKFRSLFESMSEAVALDELVLDEQGHPVDWVILDVNPAYQRMLGLTREESIGRRASEIYPDTHEFRAVLAHYGAVVLSGRPDVLETPYPRTSLHLRVSAFWLEGLRFATLSTDITEQKRAEEQLQKAVRARDEVLAVVSHDLKNPLGSIRLNAGLLRKLAGPDEAGGRITQQASRIERATERMDQLIQDLLDVAKIESTGLSLDIQPDDAMQIAREVIDLIRPLADEKSIRLESSCAGTRCCTLPCDHHRLLQVFSNLLGNAIKFTPAGGLVRVEAEERPRSAVFSVIDSGPGIRKEEQPHVFERFWQPRRPTHKGVGLGLAIAKGIVEAHGGRIWVESREGEGATFRFELPRKQGLEIDSSTTAA